MVTKSPSVRNSKNFMQKKKKNPSKVNQNMFVLLLHSLQHTNPEVKSIKNKSSVVLLKAHKVTNETFLSIPGSICYPDWWVCSSRTCSLLNDRSHDLHRFYTYKLASNKTFKEFGRASSRELNCEGWIGNVVGG